jgi:transcriptional regulator with XRE-family HTH domain
MPASSKKSCLAIVRSVAEITQKELAELVDCAPVTVQSIELGKLRLSQRLAKRIELQTGASLEWLLQNDYTVPPTCARDRGQPYTKRIYQMARAEISDPRTDPADLDFAEAVLTSAVHQLAAGFLKAYRRNQTVFFYYKLRELLEAFVAEFSPAKDLDPTLSIGKMMSQFHQLLAKAAESKKRPQLSRRYPKS